MGEGWDWDRRIRARDSKDFRVRAKRTNQIHKDDEAVPSTINKLAVSTW
jgi:hypothetical protein